MLKQIFENTLFDGRLDSENGVVYGVSILRSSSQGGKRFYEGQAMADCAELAEGATSFSTHVPGPTGNRRPEDLLGQFLTCKYDPAGGIVSGNFSYLETRRKLFESLCKKPVRGIGFSINAEGDIGRKSGREVVERIFKIRSIDLVSDTGSTVNLFEELEKADEYHNAVMGICEDISPEEKIRREEYAEILQARDTGGRIGKGMFKTDLAREEFIREYLNPPEDRDPYDVALGITRD